MEGYWVAISSLIVSATTLILGGVGLRQKARVSYTQVLESKIEQLSANVENCKRECDRLREENIMLMRKLLSVEKELDEGKK